MLVVSTQKNGVSARGALGVGSNEKDAGRDENETSNIMAI